MYSHAITRLGSTKQACADGNTPCYVLLCSMFIFPTTCSEPLRTDFMSQQGTNATRREMGVRCQMAHVERIWKPKWFCKISQL